MSNLIWLALKSIMLWYTRLTEEKFSVKKTALVFYCRIAIDIRFYAAVICSLALIF